MNSINPELLDLLERYVADELSEQERTAFETKLEEDSEVAEALDFFMAFEAEKENFGRLLMKQELQKVDLEMQKEKALTRISIIAEEVLQKMADLTQKTLEEVSRWFQPIPEYQTLQFATDRSDAVKAQTPISGKDYTNGILTFRVEKAGNYLITIENNQREILFKKSLQSNETELSLSVAGYPSGIYYWKLIDLPKDSILMGHFLVTLK